MESLHDNGRVGDQPDLRDLIDEAGAVVAGLNALTVMLDGIGDDDPTLGRELAARLTAIHDDLEDARWYATRTLRELRHLV